MQSKHITAKLQEARARLALMELRKSGKNDYSGYSYFELQDFMPATTALFAELGLCALISYGDTATLTLYNTEDSTQILTVVTPMAAANLKGCHPIQNLGAVQTYIRRYLWTTLLDLTEHDAIDARTGDKAAEPEPEPEPQPDAAPMTQKTRRQLHVVGLKYYAGDKAKWDEGRGEWVAWAGCNTGSASDLTEEQARAIIAQMEEPNNG